MNGPQPSATTGPVVPRPLTWQRCWIAAAVFGWSRALHLTMRYRWQYHPAIRDLDSGPAIFCIWHNRLALALHMHSHAATLNASHLSPNRPRRLAAMVSASRDGALLARIIEHFGAQPVRGSSSRRGPQALLELTTWAERGHDLAITPDGPRGPRYIVQPGVIALAQLTGRPIIPSGCYFRWKATLRSWDRFQVPIPFTRADMQFGEPLHVPSNVGDEQRETLRAELEKRLLVLNPD